MTTLIERACAFLDAYRADDAPWGAADAQRWLDHDGDIQRGVRAAHVVDAPNSVLADDIRQHADAAQAAAVATVQAYLRDDGLDAAVRKLAEAHNVHVTKWPDPAF